MDLKLGDVETTALIPLAIKANETRRKNARIRDEKAVEIISALGVDTADYDKFFSHEGVIARTIMLDRQMKDIISKNPDMVVVNLGAGFDNRFERVDNGRIRWFDLDLPDSVRIRKKAFPERDRVEMIPADLLNEEWCGRVSEAVKKSSSKPVFIAEGLFMYLSIDEIKTLLNVLTANFGSGVLIAEQNCKMMVKNQKHHDTVRKTNAVFRSGTDSGEEIAALNKDIRLVSEHSFNEEMSKHSIRGKLFAALMPKINDRWATFEWG